jgi:hypothetical protein
MEPLAHPSPAAFLLNMRRVYYIVTTPQGTGTKQGTYSPFTISTLHLPLFLPHPSPLRYDMSSH